MRASIVRSFSIAFVFAAVLSALLLTLASAAEDAKAEPESNDSTVMVVTLSGYENLMGDVDLVGRAFGQPTARAAAEIALGFAVGGLDGLDRSRPWAMIVRAHDKKAEPFLYVPVEDIDRFFAAVRRVFESATKEEDGTYVMEIANAQVEKIYAKQVGKWAVACPHREMLDRAPVDPMKHTAGLHEKYDVGCLIRVAEISELTFLKTLFPQGPYFSGDDEESDEELEEDDSEEDFERKGPDEEDEEEPREIPERPDFDFSDEEWQEEFRKAEEEFNKQFQPSAEEKGPGVSVRKPLDDEGNIEESEDENEDDVPEDDVPEEDDGDREANGKSIWDLLEDDADEDARQLFRDAETVEFGLTVDGKTKRVFADMEVVARPGSPLAEKIDESKDRTTRFVGFVSDNAAITWHVVSKIDSESLVEAGTSLKQQKKEILDALMKEMELPEEVDRKAIKRAAGDIFDSVEKTVAGGKFDGAMMCDMGANHFTLVAGVMVADAKKIENAAKILFHEAAKDSEIDEQDIEEEDFDKVHFYRVKVPVKDDDEARRIFGEHIELVAGFSGDAVYFAMGTDAANRLKKAIVESNLATNRSLPPMVLSVSLNKVCEFAAMTELDPDMARWARLFRESGNDRVKLGAYAIPNGLRYCLELEKGILKAALAGAEESANGR